ncbi:hypothetical protein MnTg03_00388 [bacterium MnTg03]|nr:hypothetical protein MnTg03_00388 [bacterium MnTg03]
MRGISHGVDKNFSRRMFFNQFCDRCNRVGSTDDIGTVAEKYPACIVLEQRQERIGIEQSSLQIDFPLADNHAFLSSFTSPDATVGFMVLIGHHYFIPGLPLLTNRLRHDVGVH